MKILFIIGTAGLTVLATPVLAQKYPVKPIRMIVPYTPGGAGGAQHL